MASKKIKPDARKNKYIKMPGDSHKKPYLIPILVKYGPLTSLTGAGTGTNVEKGQGGPFRRP